MESCGSPSEVQFRASRRAVSDERHQRDHGPNNAPPGYPFGRLPGSLLPRTPLQRCHQVAMQLLRMGRVRRRSVGRRKTALFRFLHPTKFRHGKRTKAHWCCRCACGCVRRVSLAAMRSPGGKDGQDDVPSTSPGLGSATAVTLRGFPKRPSIPKNVPFGQPQASPEADAAEKSLQATSDPQYNLGDLSSLTKRGHTVAGDSQYMKSCPPAYAEVFPDNGSTGESGSECHEIRPSLASIAPQGGDVECCPCRYPLCRPDAVTSIPHP